jgi:hypothetical protein
VDRIDTLKSIQTAARPDCESPTAQGP